MNEKNKVEALLFSSGKRMGLNEISELSGIKEVDKITSALNELKQDYENRGGSLSLEEEEGFWKLTVKDHYMNIAQKLITQAELDKPLMETLAVIAWKYPVLQAEVVRIRHNKAYDHLKQLEEMGFITRMVFGRTRKITLTQKFFEYFDLPSKEQRKEAFKAMVPSDKQEKIDGMEKEIDNGEKVIEDYNQKQEEMRAAKEEEIKKEKEKKLKEDVDKELEDEPVPDPDDPQKVDEPVPNPDDPQEIEKDPEELKEEAEDIKEDLDESQEKEDEEIEEIKEDEEDIEEEIDKDVYDPDEVKKDGDEPTAKTKGIEDSQDSK